MRFSNLAAAATALIAVPAWSQLTGSTHCDKGFCLTAVYDSTAQHINYTLLATGAGPSSGWYGVGQGKNMANANMVIGWVNSDSSVTTSQRSATGNNQPLVSLVKATAYTVNSPETTLMTVNGTKALSVSWLFAQTTTPSSSMPHMYAFSPKVPSSSASDATIQKHSFYKQFNMDMTAAYSAASTSSVSSAGTAAGSSSGAASSGSSSSGTSSSADDAAVRDLGSSNSTRIIFVHVIFMSVAWLLLAPLGVLIARYGRTLFTWFPHHRNVQLGTILLTFIAFFLAVSFLSVTDSPQFVETHHIVGLVITILVLIQGALGLTAHKYLAKTGRRVIGFVHAPLGLIIFGLAIWNMQTGINLWEWAPSDAFRYFIYGWMGILVLLYLGGLALIPRERKQKRTALDEKAGVEPVPSVDSTHPHSAV